MNLSSQYSGADVGNYSITGQATAEAAITPKALTAVSGVSAQNKVYDGNDQATLNTALAQFEGLVAGDSLTLAAASGQFSDRHVGTGRAAQRSRLRGRR